MRVKSQLDEILCGLQPEVISSSSVLFYFQNKQFLALESPDTFAYLSSKVTHLNLPLFFLS